MSQQTRRHLAYLGSVEPIALAQFHRAARAVKQEHGFTFRADDMDMRRRVVVGIDRDPQAVDAQDRRHDLVWRKPK